MAEKYVTPAGALAKDGSDWDNAFGLPEWVTDLAASASAGDNYWVAGGTYTLTEDLISALDGTAVAPISIIGVDSGTTNEPPVFSDWADGANQPDIVCGATFGLTVDNYWNIKNLHLTGSDTNVLIADTEAIVENCEIDNSSGTAGRIALRLGGNGGQAINCELISDAGFGVWSTSFDIRVYQCYIHDTTTSIQVGGASTIVENIIGTCTTGINLISSDFFTIIGNSIYNSATGILGTDSKSNLVYNNQITDCTTGASWTTEQLSNHWDYNNWHNNDNVPVNVTKGNNATANAPGYANAGAGNFSDVDSADGRSISRGVG